MAPCYVILQTKQLLFLCVKFLLRNDAAVQQFLVFFQFVGIACRYLILICDFYLDCIFAVKQLGSFDKRKEENNSEDAQDGPWHFEYEMILK